MIWVIIVLVVIIGTPTILWFTSPEARIKREIKKRISFRPVKSYLISGWETDKSDFPETFGFVGYFRDRYYKALYQELMSKPNWIPESWWDWIYNN